ncbi:BamA/TamA family outer membrane protein [Formosa sp. PL04]|uniref:BamA/TamA family outer membrane protein n=1 Tax=Formosa sp. PL04 TaxID=3081755 RepID=UPI0029816DA1|nr:BamA/TamA family outer membrane protein [Formosa sp. PL04]MDW5290611.1 BamA/TamA family outer membrane protein [Formosa sp. PL04]
MRAIFMLLGILFPFFAFAQDTIQNKVDTTCVQIDMSDVIRKAFHKTEKVSDKSGGLLLFPIIGSNPAIGFMMGVGGQLAFKRSGENTHYSMISGSAQYTTKNQMLFLMKNSIYSKNNKFFLTGDWRYQIFSQPTYGLGTDAPEDGILDYQYNLSGQETSIDSLAQPLKFNFLRFYQSISYNITRSLYIGAGYYLDSYSNIVDEKLNLTPGDTLLTSNYAYSKKYGFNPEKYASSAIGLNMVSDTRDNMINAYKGHYAMISWNSSLKILGSDKSADYFSMEGRFFQPLSKTNPRHLIAFWVMGESSPEGELPYLILPATAYDQRSRSGRGYAQGRFRGNQMMYAETEYRFPISQCSGLWGGVLFANATTANNPTLSVDLFDSIKPGYGFGARLMVDKKSRTNLAMDIGFGENSFGFYLSAGETF